MANRSWDKDFNEQVLIEMIAKFQQVHREAGHIVGSTTDDSAFCTDCEMDITITLTTDHLFGYRHTMFYNRAGERPGSIEAIDILREVIYGTHATLGVQSKVEQVAVHGGCCPTCGQAIA